MSTHAFIQVDAFTTRPLSGNSCAIVLDSDELDVSTMQAIAREMNLSETSFVRRSQTADIGARYFTPAEEIPLAGHPTIATIWALVERGDLALVGERTTFSLELVDGPISVEVEAHPEGSHRIIMTQREPKFLREYPAGPVLATFGLSSEDLLPGTKIQTVSTGTPQLMVPLRDHSALRRAIVDVDAYLSLRRDGDFFSPHLFCLGGATPAGDTFARHFGVPPETMEDPFTGSATGGMAAYLWRYGLIERPQLLVEQGHWMGRPGQGTVEVSGSRDAIESVRVGGQAVTVIRGELSI